MLEIATHYMHGMAQMFFLFATLLLYMTPRRTRVLNLLMLCMGYWALLELKDFIVCYPSHNANYVLDWRFVFFDLLSIPITSFYLLEQLFPGRMNGRRCLKLILPFVCMAVVYVVLLLFFPNRDYLSIGALWEDRLYPPTALRILYTLYALIYGGVMMIYLVRNTYVYGRFIRSNYSYTDELDLTWLRIFVLLLFGCMAIYGVILFFASALSDLIFYTVSLLVWLFIYQHAIRQKIPEIASDYWVEKESQSQKASSESSYDRGFGECLREIFEEEKIYLNPTLSIVELASRCGTNRTYLSQYFNNVLHVSFYDYVNRYRVEHAAVPLLQQMNGGNMEEIALKSGFGSISTFRRAFVKFTGKTPQAYKKHYGEASPSFGVKKFWPMQEEASSSEESNGSNSEKEG